MAQKARDWFAGHGIHRPEQVMSVIVPYGTANGA
jgi:hypothetical protein